MRWGATPAALLLTAFAAASAGAGPVASAPPAAPPAPVLAPAPTPAAPTLWRLPASPAELRIVGEAGSLAWPVYVPAASVPAVRQLRIGYRAAIQVMPEASALTLTVNGQMVGRTPIAAPTREKTVSFDLPPGLVQPGWNAVGVAVAQTHRVDCSLASTYELWTELDAAATGLVGPPPRLASVDDLQALPTDAAGIARLHLMLPRDPAPAEIARAVRVAERVALRAHARHPVVDTDGAAPGLRIAVGTAVQLAGLPGLAGRPASGVTLDGAAEGGPLLLVGAATEEELDRLIEAFGREAPAAAGTDEGLAVLARQGGRRLRPGSSLTFADLGIRSKTFAGRLFRQAFDIVLPPDAYTADYAEAQLALDGGYAPGLLDSARFTVRVNGVLDGNLNFDDPRGVVLQRRIIHMPLEPFHPGHNRVEIEAQLPARADASCDTLNAIGAKERLLLLGSSTLSLPPLARVAQFPSLAAALTGNLRVTPRSPPRLFLPRSTGGAVAAAATLLTNASLDSGVPAEAVFGRGTPEAGSEPAIVVATGADLPASLLAAAGLDPVLAASAWRGVPAAGPASGAPARAAATGEVSDGARLDAWGQHLDDGPAFGALGSAAEALAGALAQSLRVAGLVPYPDRAVAITGDTTFVVAQGMAGDAPLTLLTGRDEASLAAGAALLTDPERLAALQGRAASFDDGVKGAAIVPAREVTFYRTQDFSLGNDRLVAAGWVSKHAGWYLGAVLLALGLLGASTTAVLRFGRKEAP